MEIQYDGTQQYQIDAINAVCDIFMSQPLSFSTASISFSPGYGELISEYGIANNLKIDEDTVLGNLQHVQEKNAIQKSAELDGMNFSVEMETGTGKTYVYLRTVYELSKRYGFKKFVIVVPSVAIREGVMKSIEMTKRHFGDLYANMPCEARVYDSARLACVRQFAASNQIQMLIINIDAFNKDTNIINLEQECLSGRRPIDFLSSCRPIVIIDEPQNVESDLSAKAVAALHPLCTLRYSATHRRLYNLVYRLTPIQAYDMGLVKRIEVDSVLDGQDFQQPYLKLVSIQATRNRIVARIELDIQKGDVTARKTISVSKNGTDLFDISGRRDVYRGYVVQDIDAANQYLSFSNGHEIAVGETQGANKDAVMRAQIQETVREHFEKTL